MSFGKKLKEIRKQYQLSQAEMSNRLIMDQSSYSRYENDKTIPTIDIINRVVDIFGVSLYWIMEPERSNNNFGTIAEVKNHYSVPKYIVENLMQQQIILNKILQEILSSGN